MPSVRHDPNMWCGADDKLDDRVFRARQRGILIQGDEALEVQRAISNGEVDGDSKNLHARITAANAIAHQALAKLSKLDNRYKEKQEVSHLGGPMIIGWASDFADTPEETAVIDVTPKPKHLSEPETTPNDGDAQDMH
jgi:hypothetical protein